MGVGNLLGIGASMLGMATQDNRQSQQYQRQRNLMGLQNRNQQKLNQQGANLQYDMWKKTNYPAQVEMLKEAGLNPALMYGQGGGGGTTAGSQTGGSASGGQASAPMDIGGATQMGLMASQMEVNKASAKKMEAEADNLRGVEGTKGASEIEKLIAETGTEAEKQALIKAQTLVQKAQEQNVGKDTELKDSNIKKVEQDTKLSKEQKMTEQFKQSNIQADTQLKGAQIGVQEQERLLRKYEAELNALGIQKTDNKVFRYLTKKASEMGITLESLISQM